MKITVSNAGLSEQELASLPLEEVRARAEKEQANPTEPIIKEASRIAEAEEILSLVAPKTDVIVLEREILIGDEPHTFHIKRLSHAEVSKIDGKKYRRGAHQQLIKDVEYEETVGLAWQIHLCVVVDKNAGVVDDEGEPLKPRWEPMFTLEQVLGGGKKIGLMTNPEPAAQELIYALGTAIWEVNEQLNPLAAAAAAAQMGLT